MKMRRKRWFLTLAILLFILIMVSIFCTLIGPAQISLLSTLKIIIHKLPLLGKVITPSFLRIEETIILKVRLPRILLGAIVGAALAVAGVVFQGLLRNPLADPYLLGVSSGAALGASLSLLLGLGGRLLGFSLPLFAFLGALLSLILVYNLARKDGKIPLVTLILAGIIVSTFLSAVLMLIMSLAGRDLHNLIFWLMGTLSEGDLSLIKIILLCVIVGITIIFFFARELNAFSLGEEEAQHLGVEVERVKKTLLVFASLITAAVVSITGLIGFVGLVVPHITRIIVGPDHRILIPASLLMGSILLIIADTLARSLTSFEIPVGIVTALLGGPFFLYLLRKRKEVGW